MNDPKLQCTPVWLRATAISYFALMAIQLFAAQHWSGADIIPGGVGMLLCCVGFALCVTAFRSPWVKNWHLVIIDTTFIVVGVYCALR
jgi:hypothetical protein